MWGWLSSENELPSMVRTRGESLVPTAQQHASETSQAADWLPGVRERGLRASRRLVRNGDDDVNRSDVDGSHLSSMDIPSRLRSHVRLAEMVFTLCSAGVVLGCARQVPQAHTVNPTQLYLEGVVEAEPGLDPSLLFVLLGQYGATGKARVGVTFVERMLSRPDLPEDVRPVFLAVSGALRAQSAEEITLLKRIAWVKRGMAELNEAVTLAGEETYVLRWLRAVVFAQLPARFDAEALALSELKWLEAHAAKAPVPGLVREVLFQQSVVYARQGKAQAAAAYLARSGYDSRERPAVFTTPFSLSPAVGFTFAEAAVVEVLKDRVYHARGYDFGEFYFVVTRDRSALVAVDMGAREDSAAAAVEALRAQVPGLPPISHVLITHAHWDHVGGAALLPRAQARSHGHRQRTLACPSRSPGGDRRALQVLVGPAFRPLRRHRFSAGPDH